LGDGLAIALFSGRARLGRATFRPRWRGFPRFPGTFPHFGQRIFPEVAGLREPLPIRHTAQSESQKGENPAGNLSNQM